VGSLAILQPSAAIIFNNLEHLSYCSLKYCQLMSKNFMNASKALSNLTNAYFAFTLIKRRNRPKYRNFERFYKKSALLIKNSISFIWENISIAICNTLSSPNGSTSTLLPLTESSKKATNKTTKIRLKSHLVAELEQNKWTNDIWDIWLFWVYDNQSLGIPATICPSIPHSLFPLLILKKPLSPHPSFQLLATNQ